MTHPYLELAKALTDQATFEREQERHDKASGLEIAAKTLTLIATDNLEPKDALDRAVGEQDADEFFAAVDGITP